MAIYSTPSVGGISISFPNIQEGEVEDIRYKGDKSEDFPPFRLEGPQGLPPDDQSLKGKRFDPSMVKEYPGGHWDLSNDTYDEDSWHAFGRWHEEKYGKWPGFMLERSEGGVPYGTLRERMEEFKDFKYTPKMNQAPQGLVQQARFQGAVPETVQRHGENRMDPSAPHPYSHMDYPESSWMPRELENLDPGIRGKDEGRGFESHGQRKDMQFFENIRHIPEGSVSINIEDLPPQGPEAIMGHDRRTVNSIEGMEERTQTRNFDTTEKHQERDRRQQKRRELNERLRNPLGVSPGELYNQLAPTEAETFPEGYENELDEQGRTPKTPLKDIYDIPEIKQGIENLPTWVKILEGTPQKFAETMLHMVKDLVQGAWNLGENPPRNMEEVDRAVKSSTDVAMGVTGLGYLRNAFRTGAMGVELGASGGKFGPGRLGVITDKSNHILQREPKFVEDVLAKLKVETEILGLNKDIPQIRARVDGVMEDMAAIEALLPSREYLGRAIRDIADKKEMKKTATPEMSKILDDSIANTQKIADQLEKQIENGVNAVAKHSDEYASGIDRVEIKQSRQINPTPYQEAQLDQQLKNMFKGFEEITPLERIQILGEQRDRLLNILKDPKLDPLERVSIQDMVGRMENEILGRAGAAGDLRLIKGGKPGKAANENTPIVDESLGAVDRRLVTEYPELNRLNNAFNEAYAKNRNSKETVNLGKDYKRLKDKILKAEEDSGPTLGVGGGRLRSGSSVTDSETMRYFADADVSNFISEQLKANRTHKQIARDVIDKFDPPAGVNVQGKHIKEFEKILLEDGSTLGVGGGRLQTTTNWMAAKDQYLKSPRTRDDLERYANSLRESVESIQSQVEVLQKTRGVNPAQIEKLLNEDKKIRHEWSNISKDYHTFKPKPSEVDWDVVDSIRQQYPHMTREEIVNGLYSTDPRFNLPPPLALSEEIIQMRPDLFRSEIPSVIQDEIRSIISSDKVIKGDVSKQLYDRMKSEYPEVEMSIKAFKSRVKQLRNDVLEQETGGPGSTLGVGGGRISGGARKRGLDKIDDKKLDTIIKMDKEGFTPTEIAERLGFSRQAINKRLVEMREKGLSDGP